ncbi:MAG: hypothetical protein ACOY5Y_11265 [Pseudomonadota bacterium]
MDAEAVDRARRLLAESAARDPAWPALVAAAALALTSVIFATVMVLAPPLERHSAARAAPV